MSCPLRTETAWSSSERMKRRLVHRIRLRRCLARMPTSSSLEQSDRAGIFFRSLLDTFSRETGSQISKDDAQTEVVSFDGALRSVSGEMPRCTREIAEGLCQEIQLLEPSGLTSIQ